ncbi:MAG: hypothetical protein LBD29_03960 [Treponema sp.]|jgi:hypothetical protein|nr:hypothetical protein [Treponema sp.]
MNWSIIFSVTSLILCGFFFFYFKNYLRRRTGPEQLAEFREEVYKLIAEIDAATDKDALLVEERIKTLRGILEDVDKRIGVHIREMDRRRFQEETYAELGRKRIVGAFPTGYQKIQKAVDLFTVPETPGLEKSNFSEKAEPAEPVIEPRPRIVVPERQIEPKPPPFRDHVLELSKAGLAPGLIALRLNVSIAEVEAVIAISGDL